MIKIKNFYDKLEEYLLVSSLIINVIIVFSQVIMRSVFNYSLSWTEELSRYIFIWQTWLGTSTALKYDQHIKVDLIYSFVKNERVQKVFKILAYLIWFAFSLFLAYIGWKLTKSMASRHALSSGMRISLVFVYVVLPISSSLVCLRLIPKIYANVKNIITPDDNISEGGNV